MWFAGAHADVGGGYPDTRLSDIALNWMAAEATRTAETTASPLAFSGLPKPVAVKTPLLPHHAIQGDFFWATPAPRDAMVGVATLSPEVTATFRVHASALQRLFDGAATTYEEYPFAKDYKWTRHLPGGSEYPQDVAGALSWLDDLAVRLHVSAMVSDDARVVRHGGRTLTPETPTATRLAAWRFVQSVTELRLFEQYLARSRADFARSGVNVSKLCDAFALLLAFGRSQTFDSFVGAMTERARRLTRVAGLSTKFGLAIRTRWLPRFEGLCQAALHCESACPSQLASEARRIGQELCKVKSDLRAALPYKALPRAVLKKRSPPSSPTG